MNVLQCQANEALKTLSSINLGPFVIVDMHNLTKTNEYSVILIRVLLKLVQTHRHLGSLADDLYVIATAHQCLAILFNTLFSMHRPVMSVSVELLEEENTSV